MKEKETSESRASVFWIPFLSRSGMEMPKKPLKSEFEVSKNGKGKEGDGIANRELFWPKCA